MIKTGDNVRFLNSVGGGIVVRIDEKKNLVFVADEDGFEIPALARECVVVGAVNETTNFPRKEIKATHIDSNVNQHVTYEKSAGSPFASELPVVETPEGDTLKVFLAFIPKEPKRLSDTGYECFLVNDSNYFLFYNLVVGLETNRRSVTHGIIEPNMQDQIADIDKVHLNNWERVRVQIIPFKKDKTYCEQSALDLLLKISTVKFYKLHSFTESEYFDEPCMMFDLPELIEKKRLTDISPDEIKRAMLDKRPSSTGKAKVPNKTTTTKNELIEIDLHIHALLDTTTGMSNTEILAYQMDVFRNTLNENKNRKGQKIVFIHGKGEGVLRKEIEKELKTKHKTYYFQDASFREYGFGATMVTIK